jgi:hypothetical protein
MDFRKSSSHALLALACAAALSSGTALASSHREAPLISGMPKVDATDFYMFRSYEPGREAFVTFIANYQPLQDEYCGPNCFQMDPDAVYSILVDNNGDAVSDHAFQFRFVNVTRNLAIPVGDRTLPVPLGNIGPVTTANRSALNTIEAYYVVTEGGRAANLSGAQGSVTFLKPYDNLGRKSLPDYEGYALSHVAQIGLPGCATPGKVFVGQRREPFFVNLGEVFDLINTNPVGPVDAEENALAGKNITTIALEVPIACLTNGTDPVIGAWTTAKSNTTGRQFSRLGHPLVNEVVIGLPDKDKFNASNPVDDLQFAKYVTNPTLPELIEILYPQVQAPNSFPRADLVNVFLTGFNGLNRPVNVKPAEILRLNTSIAPRAQASQNNLGVIANDLSGFPNGRRPGDDIVDISLRVMMGKLLPADVAPSGQLPFTDGVFRNARNFYNAFPYLTEPLAGSPNSTP